MVTNTTVRDCRWPVVMQRLHLATRAESTDSVSASSCPTTNPDTEQLPRARRRRDVGRDTPEREFGNSGNVSQQRADIQNGQLQRVRNLGLLVQRSGWKLGRADTLTACAACGNFLSMWQPEQWERSVVYSNCASWSLRCNTICPRDRLPLCDTDNPGHHRNCRSNAWHCRRSHIPGFRKPDHNPSVAPARC